MGSTSLTTTTDSGGSSSSSPPNNNSTDDSLHGLKFGRKIYFEDGTLAPPKSGSSSSAGAKKQRSSGGGGFVHHGQPPRCQVEGCNVDLSDVKAYYSRHKVCAMHSKTPTVVVAGLEQRFCQQCSRYYFYTIFALSICLLCF